MDKTHVKYAYCFNDNDNIDIKLCSTVISEHGLPKIKLKLPQISLKECSNLDIVIA